MGDLPIADVLAGSAKTAQFTIKPIMSASSGLVITAKADEMAVDLTKIRAPDHDAAAAYKSAKSAAAVPEQLRAGKISFDVWSRLPGCAAVSFAIFEHLKTLDHLVLRVVTKDDKGNLPDCAKSVKVGSSQLTGGLDALRDASLGTDTQSGPLIGDAALYVFEADNGNSRVVFIDGRKGVKQTVYGWENDGSVVDYLRNPGFEKKMVEARDDAAQGREGPYTGVADELWTLLFSAYKYSDTQKEADNAAGAFKTLVSDASSPPTIIVRIASKLGNGATRSLFAPFGILSAKGPGAKPILVVQPLAKDRPASPERCIGNWTLALPDSLGKGVGMDTTDFPNPLPGPRISDISGFGTFLKSGDPENATPARGLVLLAHQGEGAIWFDAETKRIIKQKISGTFSAGSAGILAACSVAATTSRNAELLEKLNEQGFDTLIASPFALNPKYGVKFSYSFVEAVREALMKDEQPTILELFNSAVAKTTAKFAKGEVGKYEELGLEYVLLGNPSIKLCKASTAPTR